MTLVVICAYMLTGHLLSLPTPELNNPKLHIAIHRRLEAIQDRDWLALHVLYGDCGCSRRVIRHLKRRGPSSLAEEWILLVKPKTNDLKSLESAGFNNIEVTTPHVLHNNFAISAAPLMVVAHTSGKIQYVGGYTERKRGPEIQDIQILQTIRAGNTPEKLPLFGCATNVELARKVDPLGLR